MLSKIFWIIMSPLTLIALLMLGGSMALWLGGEWGRHLIRAGVGLFLILGFLPIGINLAVFLESRYDKPELPEKIDGIIVLGGMIESKKSQLHGQASINDNAERLTELLRLSQAYPQARIIFSGGSASLIADSPKESIVAEKLLKDIGFQASRIEFEDHSRNTYENMIYSKEMVHPQQGETWVLITSAFHLPRSVAIFEKGGWPVVPYPAGYIEDPHYMYRPTLDLLGNFYKLKVASREIVGIIAYSLTGKL